MTPGDREAILASWIRPSSLNEQDQQVRALRVVRQAIDKWPGFNGHRSGISAYTQGSYPNNNTKVRVDKHVHVVENTGDFFYDWGPDISAAVSGTITLRRLLEPISVASRDGQGSGFGVWELDRQQQQNRDLHPAGLQKPAERGRGPVVPLASVLEDGPAGLHRGQLRL